MLRPYAALVLFGFLSTGLAVASPEFDQEEDNRNSSCDVSFQAPPRYSAIMNLVTHRFSSPPRVEWLLLRQLSRRLLHKRRGVHVHPAEVPRGVLLLHGPEVRRLGLAR